MDEQKSLVPSDATIISFATSVKTFSLNGACDVTFSPSDGLFAEKLFNVLDTLGKKQDEYEKQVEKAMGSRKVFDIAQVRDAEMREMVNGVFGKDVCSALFPGRSIYSMADGLPEWCNLIMAVIDIMDVTLTAEQKATNPRVQQYTKRYQKYQKYQR